MSTMLTRGGSIGDIVTIPLGDKESSAYDARAGITWALFTPAALTGDEFSIEVAPTADGPWRALPKDDGSGDPYTFAVAADAAYPLPLNLAPFPYFRLVSDEDEVAARELRIVSKR